MITWAWWNKAIPVLALVLLVTSEAASVRYRVQTEAGYIPPPSSVALQQYLTAPVAVAYDAKGALYYATPSQVWRRNGDGSATALTVGASLTGISALVLDASQNLYVADSQSDTIRKLTPDGRASIFAGTGRISRTVSNAGPGVAASQVEISPSGLVVDSAGTVYAADIAHAAIVAFSADGQSSRVIAGNTSLNSPGALALSGDFLFVADAGSLGIHQIDLRTGIMAMVVGQPAPSLPMGLGLGTGLSVAADGGLYIQGVHAVWKFNLSSGSASLIAGTGVYGYSGDGGPATAATLEDPGALAVSPVTGDLAIADSLTHTVRVVVATQSTIQTVAGRRHFEGDNGPAKAAVFDGAQCLASDSSGNLLFAEINNNRIRKVTPAGVISTVAGTGDSGYSGDGGPAVAAELALGAGASFSGSCLTTDKSGNMYIADAGNGVVRRVDAKGVITTVAGGGNEPPADGVSATAVAIQPSAIAVDGAGNLYLAQTGQIFRLQMSGGLSVVAGDGTVESSGDGGPAVSAHVGVISCMVADDAGNVYFCDALTSVVRRIDAQNQIATIAGNGSWSSDPITPGPATATPLGSLSSLALDAAGDLYLHADTGPPFNQIAMVRSRGTLSLLGLPGGFTRITGMTVDRSGYLHLVDGGVFVRKIIPAVLRGLVR